MQPRTPHERLDLLTLMWLWWRQGTPAKQAAIATALKSLLPPEGASGLSSSLSRLVEVGQVERIQSAKKTGSPVFRITPAGQRQAGEFLGREQLPPAPKAFPALALSLLPAMCVGIAVPGPGREEQNAMGKLLPVAVCVRHFNLEVPLDEGAEAAKLALVKLALIKLARSENQELAMDKIHLKKVPGELPALVVAPLLQAAGTAVKDLNALLSAAAQRLLNVSKPAQIKTAVVKRWLAGGAREESPQTPPPDLRSFSQAVLEAAREVADDGREGVSNLKDKVMVHYCWNRYERLHGPIALEVFKHRLSEANGEHLVLVREDLIPEDRFEEFQRSEVRTGASTYHYIRV